MGNPPWLGTHVPSSRMIQTSFAAHGNPHLNGRNIIFKMNGISTKTWLFTTMLLYLMNEPLVGCGSKSICHLLGANLTNIWNRWLCTRWCPIHSKGGENKQDVKGFWQIIKHIQFSHCKNAHTHIYIYAYTYTCTSHNLDEVIIEFITGGTTLLYCKDQVHQSGFKHPTDCWDSSGRPWPNDFHSRVIMAVEV